MPPRRAAAPAAHRPPAPPAAAGGKTQPPLRRTLGGQQQRHHQQQHRRQLRRGHAVVHHQPGLEDAGAEGRQAEIGTDAVVGQRLHQCQRHAGRDGRARQRQRDLEDAPPRPGAQQPRRLHQLHRAFAQRGARQQVHVRIEAQHEQDHRTPQAAHVGPQRGRACPAAGADRPAAGCCTAAHRSRRRPARRPAWPAAAATPTRSCAGQGSRTA